MIEAGCICGLGHFDGCTPECCPVHGTPQPAPRKREPVDLDALDRELRNTRQMLDLPSAGDAQVLRQRHDADPRPAWRRPCAEGKQMTEETKWLVAAGAFGVAALFWINVVWQFWMDNGFGGLVGVLLLVGCVVAVVKFARSPL